MMGSKSALSGPRLDSSVWLSFLLFVWFSSSIASTLINKVLMMHFPYPVSISAVHMLSSVIVDWFIIVSRGLSLRPFRQDVFWQCLPVAATINFGKTLTYVSYGMVPASLTHTAKASSPVFSVLLTKLMYDKWPSGTTCLALVPLTLGVTLSALTELNFVLVGFFAAIAAALANVLNSIYTKRAISHVACPDPIIFHMYTAATATLMLTPYALIKDARDWLNGVHYVFDPTAVAADGAVAFRLLMFSVSLHYLQNISSIYFLAHVSVLSHQVAQSMKRLMVITCSVFYFSTPVTALNVVGMGLALVGFSAYSLTKQTGGGQGGGGGGGGGQGGSAGRRGSLDMLSEMERDEREGDAGVREGSPSSGYHSSASVRGHSSRSSTPRHADGMYQPTPMSISTTSLSSSSSSSPPPPSSATSRLFALFRPPSSPAPNSPGVLDSYALVQQSDLGSSHLLQSPARTKPQPPHINGFHHSSAHLTPSPSSSSSSSSSSHHQHALSSQQHASLPQQTRMEESHFLLDSQQQQDEDDRGGGGGRRNGHV